MFSLFIIPLCIKVKKRPIKSKRVVETCDEKVCPGYCLCYKNMLYVLYLFSKSSETFVSIFQRMIYRIMHWIVMKKLIKGGFECILYTQMHGTKGIIMPKIREIPVEERKEFGQKINAIKNKIEQSASMMNCGVVYWKKKGGLWWKEKQGLKFFWHMRCAYWWRLR